MSYLADHDTNCNPSKVKVDDDGFAVTKMVNRRDSKKWVESLVYVVKDRSYQYELLDLVKEELQVRI